MSTHSRISISIRRSTPQIRVLRHAAMHSRGRAQRVDAALADVCMAREQVRRERARVRMGVACVRGCTGEWGGQALQAAHVLHDAGKCTQVHAAYVRHLPLVALLL